MFIKRIQKYAVKLLKSDTARVYIQNPLFLKKANFVANALIHVSYEKSRIVITLKENGERKVMDSSRGELIELKNKDTFKSLLGCNSVVVTFKTNKIIIKVPKSFTETQKRTVGFIDKLSSGKPLTSASLFSGIGLLALSIKRGLEAAGVKTKLSFANDSDELALTCSAEGNPIWKDASNNAVIDGRDIRELDISELPIVDILEIGLPCVNQSKLCEKKKRDLNHPIVGTLFITIVNVIKKMNPSIIILENAPSFLNSDTLALIKSELKDRYTFDSRILKGSEFGGIEERSRACVVATPLGFPELNLAELKPKLSLLTPSLGDLLEDIRNDSPLWREMGHVKAKLNNPKLNYKNTLFTADSTKIGTMTATYHSPKIGSPMLAHPENPELQRQFTALEGCRIRELPLSLLEVLMSVAKGEHWLCKSKSNVGAVHRMNGNSVSPKPWFALGEWLGDYFRTLIY